MTSFAVGISVYTNLESAILHPFSGFRNRPEMYIFSAISNSQTVVAILNMITFKQHVRAASGETLKIECISLTLYFLERAQTHRHCVW